MSVVRGEESHGRFRGGDRQPLVVRPLRYLGGVGGKGSRGSRIVRGGVGVRKVVGVGGGQLWAVGVGGNKEVKKDRGDTGALWDSCAGMSIGGSGVVVSAAGHPPAQEGG